MARIKTARPGGTSPPRISSRHIRRGPSTAPRRPGLHAVASYDRRTELPRVLPLWPHEIDDDSPQGRFHILRKLRKALRAERRRGIAGHWTYDLARHVELLRVYRLELASVGLGNPACTAERPTRE